MKVAIATYLIPAATLILPGCAQLLQGRFNVGFRHVATALLISNLAFFLPVPWVGILASILWVAVGCWSAYDAWDWERDEASTRPPVQSMARPTGPPLPWYRRYLPVVLLGVLQVVALGEIMVMMIMAALAVMIFDAPGSTKRIENWVFFMGLALMPVVAMVLCAVAWGLYRRGRALWALVTLSGVVLAGLLALGVILGPDLLQ